MSTSQLQQPAFSSGLAHKLPIELLAETFCYYVALDNSPWHLALVCRKWRMVALSTPSLWTHIIVTAEKCRKDIIWSVFGAETRSNGRASVCQTPDDLKNATYRAGVLPLHVNIMGESNPESEEGLLFIMKEVFSPAVAPRIGTLRIHISTYLPIASLHSLGLCPRLPSGLLPRLQALCIKEMPRLWTKELLNAAGTPCCNSLRSLHLPDSLGSLRLPQGIDEDEMSSILTAFPNLEQLSGCPLLWPDDRTPETVIARLQHLELVCRSMYIGRLQLPQLQSLVVLDLRSSRLSYGDDFGKIDLPELTNLRATTQEIRWVEFLTAPKLRLLSIIGMLYPSTDNPHVQFISPNRLPSVEHLVLETSPIQGGDGDAQDSLLIAMLQAVPNARSIRLSTGSSSREDPKLRLQLLDRLGAMEEEEILCRNLRELHLISRHSRGSLADYEVYLLQRIVEVRKQMNRELRRLLVQWTDKSAKIITQHYA